MPIQLRWVLGVAGVAIALAALAVNILFYSSYGTDETTRIVFTALAVISLALKILAPLAAGYKPPPLVAIALWASFAAAVAFDSLGTAGYIEMTYGTKTGEASRYADDYKDAGAEVSKLETLYQEYASERPTAEVAAEHTAAETAGRCTAKRAHLDACKRVAELGAEKARAEERDKREREWRGAKSKFDTMQKPQIAADPQGAVFERLGSRIGFSDMKSFVAPIISILIFIFFEIGGPALIYVALHGQGDIKVASEPRPRGADLARAPRESGRRRATATADGVLEALRSLIASGGCAGVSASGNRIVAPQRALGAAIGVSAAKLNRHLGELRAAGTISARTVPEGTEIIIL